MFLIIIMICKWTSKPIMLKLWINGHFKLLLDLTHAIDGHRKFSGLKDSHGREKNIIKHNQENHHRLFAVSICCNHKHIVPFIVSTMFYIENTYHARVHTLCVSHMTWQYWQLSVCVISLSSFVTIWLTKNSFIVRTAKR